MYCLCWVDAAGVCGTEQSNGQPGVRGEGPPGHGGDMAEEERTPPPCRQHHQRD